ncbi:MAG: DUF5979 domain-containing protein, partial [Acidimicrobiia bacterium]
AIVIVKDAEPDDPQDFSFTTTCAGLSNFSLDDDDTIKGGERKTLPSSKTFLDLVSGTYTVTEGEEDGWGLKDLSCTVEPSSGHTSFFSGWSQAGNVASIDLAAGETVTCTFTNSMLGTVIVNKTALGGDAAFGYTNTGGGTLPPASS